MRKIKHIAIAAFALMISASSVFAFVQEISHQSTVSSPQFTVRFCRFSLSGVTCSLQCGKKNRSTKYIFDWMNQMNRIKYPDNSEAKFSYDNAGNMTYASNQNAVITYTYDNMNRITNTISLRSLRSFAANYSYDSNGNRTNITYPTCPSEPWQSGGGLSVSYQYDTANRLSGVSVLGVSVPLCESDRPVNLPPTRTSYNISILWFFACFMRIRRNSPFILAFLL